MKRMRPDAYKIEAQLRVQRATGDLIARFGTWNAKKVKRVMEDILKSERLSEKEMSEVRDKRRENGTDHAEQ